MSKIFEHDNFKVLWGTVIKEIDFDTTNFPQIEPGSKEPFDLVDGLDQVKDLIIDGAKDFTPKTDIEPVLASSWISSFNPNSSGMNIHTDEDHGGTISAVIWYEGEEGQGGDLVLWDPRWENPKLWGGVKGDGKVTIPFKPGKIIMFPSSVWHGVTAYTGSKDRNSINCVLTYKDVKEIALQGAIQDQVKEIGNKLGISLDGTNENILEILKTANNKL